MDKTRFDQAEGLRRMLAGSRPRIFTFVSTTTGEDKSAMLANLGASLVAAGRSVLLLDASVGTRGAASYLDLPQVVTLLHVARREYDLDNAICHAPQGFSVATLGRSSLTAAMRNRVQAARLSSALDILAGRFDVMMVDAELDAQDNFPLPAIAEGEIVVQVTDSAASIKAAYAVIKRIGAQHGRRPFSLLVTGTSEQRAQVIYANMARAASRYLAVPLHSIGHVPADECVVRAARQGRTVVDAFPRAGAAVAFRRLAGYFSCSTTAAAGYGMMSG